MHLVLHYYRITQQARKRDKRERHSKYAKYINAQSATPAVTILDIPHIVPCNYVHLTDFGVASCKTRHNSVAISRVITQISRDPQRCHNFARSRKPMIFACVLRDDHGEGCTAQNDISIICHVIRSLDGRLSREKRMERKREKETKVSEVEAACSGPAFILLHLEISRVRVHRVPLFHFGTSPLPETHCSLLQRVLLRRYVSIISHCDLPTSVKLGYYQFARVCVYASCSFKRKQLKTCVHCSF